MSKTTKNSLLDDYSGVLTTGVDYTIGAVGSTTWTVGTGTGGTTWNMPNVAISDNLYTTSTWPTTSVSQSGQLELRGDNADIKINGRSLMEAIDALEQRLHILVPNPELEKEWDELRELGERYRELEKQCKEKGNMWNKLKTMPPPTK
jgi:hypothetical protein